MLGRKILMKKYIIANDVDVKNSNSVMELIPNAEGVNVFGALAIPIFGGAIAGAMILKEMLDNDCEEISTLSELDKYSCVGTEWKKNCVYVEHPKVSKRLIEASLYKDYILKELMSEIFSYITDSISVKRIVLGLETKNMLKGTASVPIDQLVAEASVKGSLNSNYICKLENIECSNIEGREYYWIKYYPDIVAAVQKKAGKLEIEQSIKMDLEVGGGVKDIMKGAFKSEKEYNFYIYYERA